jgi:hypothetical protein
MFVQCKFIRNIFSLLPLIRHIFCICFAIFRLWSEIYVAVFRHAKVKIVVPVFNSASCHEDIWGSEGIAPHILNLGSI